MRFEVRRHLTPGNNWWRNCTTAAALALFAAACGGDGPAGSMGPNSPGVTTGPNNTPPVSDLPSLGLTETGNGSGQCLEADAIDASEEYGFIQNLGPGDLNCTSNDVDISFAEVTYYSINNPNPAGGFTALPQGQSIECVPGDIIYAVTNAKIENSASERYDLGLWINPTSGGNALTGSSCLHFNLIPGEGGSTTEEELPNSGTPDACGDMASGVLATIPLDTLVLTCPAGGATSLSIGACAAWSNSTTGNGDRVCPLPTETGAEAFRLGTTPETSAKCRCEPMVLPIIVKGVIRVDKVTVPSGDPQSFAFTPSGTGFTAPFNLTDASTPHSSGPINAGTYTITETVPTGWDLTARSCVLTGTSTPATFSTSVAGQISVTLGSGQDVTCTFTNTKRASVTIKKVTIPAEDPAVGSFSFSQNFDGTGNFSLGHNGTKVFSNVVAGVAKTVVESDPSPGYALTSIGCTGAATFTGTVSTRTLSVTPAPGETILCTFTNTRASVNVSKTATETFTRQYLWQVVKTATPNSVTLDPGQVYNHPYSVTASVTGSTDKAWAVSGNITISNPTGATVSVTGVTDAIAGVGAATVVCPSAFPFNIAAGGNVVCTYSSTLPNATTRLNTATVTLAGVAGNFQGTANVDFTGVSPNAVEDNCLVVKDIGDLGNTDPLGTVCVSGTTMPAGAFTAPKTFNYTRLVPTGAAQCGVFTYDNTATGTTNTSATQVTDSETIEVTIECPVGCTLTQGYWKTHNVLFPGGAPPDPDWASVGGPGATFFLSGQTWYEVFWTAPKGNVYYNLAHQYMAAVLNLTGATPSAQVQDAIDDAKALFETYTPAQIAALKGNSTLRAEFLTLAGILGSFNEGSLGVEHCSEDQTSLLQLNSTTK